MAAPMVSGIAALALSILGAAAGDYYQVCGEGQRLRTITRCDPAPWGAEGSGPLLISFIGV
jgi:hypothetical protein